MKKFLLSWFVVFAVLGFIGESVAATLYVDLNSANPAAPYADWNTAATNIQDAVDAAVSGDTVSVTNGHYLLPSEITVTNSITIRSANGADATIVDGNNAVRCFNLGDTASTVSGFTIQHGKALGSSPDTSGGGVYCSSTNPVVEYCAITDNSAFYGGGMYGGTANNCMISDNLVTSYGDGGGVYGVMANNCMISSNSAPGAYSSGGGMYGGTANNCTIIGNSVNSDGGGAYGGTLNNCILKNNSAGHWGGGAYNTALNNCILLENSAYYIGGGSFGGSLINCTVSKNSAQDGGGVSRGDLKNCIVWGNSASIDRHDVADGSVSYTCASDIEAGVNGSITNDPYFSNSENGNFDLLANSPCINAGTNASAFGGTDLAGNPRIVSGIVDMGAFEAPDLPSYMITTTVNGGGVIAPSNPEVFDGHDQSMSIEPSSGYYIESLVVDGVAVPPAETYLFSNVQAVHSIAATFAIIQYELTVLSGSGGGSYDPGTEVDVVADAAESGFAFTRWTVEPDSYSSRVSDPYSISTTFAMPEINIVLTANYGALRCYVDVSRPDDSGDGQSWSTAKKTIQAGVDSVALNGDVWVTDGHYLLTSEIRVSKNITIWSVNGPESTIVDGDGVTRCFNLMDSDCLVSGFTITNGNSADYGGGIDCWYASPAVVENCVITGNSAAYYGGGMSDGTANNCTITGNFSGRFGGGMSDGIANNCIISRNFAEIGGGIADGTANNCLISGNEANNYAGGVDDCIANNCTIIENTAGYGCGINRGTAHNCIVWYNATGQGYEDNLRSTIAKHTSSPEVTQGVDGNITNAPLLVSASHIAPGSPCRGAGSSLYSNGVDVDGEAWLNPPSMGCDEYHGVGSVTGVVEVAFDGAFKVVENYPANFSAKIDGPITMHVWDFGDGTRITNNIHPSHAWGVSGNYAVLLTAFSDTYPEGVSATQVVQVVSQSGSAIHVSVQTGNDANDGLGWATAKATIQAGVDALDILHGTVLVSNGTYAVSSKIKVNKDLIIQSVNGPEVTFVDGSGSNRCFYLESIVCRISGFTVANGYTSEGHTSTATGGGINCSTIYPVVENCVIVGNIAEDRGGGMYKGTAENCTMTNNYANYGGGMSYGLANNCTISGNVAGRYGGGLNSCTANNCTITSNSGAYGGGMHSGTANNCIINGNTAGTGGGMRYGMANNCTFIGNTASDYGGGMNRGTANNCIIWHNTAGRVGDNLSGVVVSHSCSLEVTPGIDGNITNAPFFVDFIGGDYHLQSNSLCINWGNNSHVSSAEDLDGNPRIVEGYVDMGCHEYQGILGLADSDGDGLLDEWERQWFGGNVLPDANPDADVSPNEDEFITGTDPTNGASYFATENSVAEINGTNCFVVEWISIPDRLYSVQWSTNLVAGFQTLETGIEHPQGSYTDTTHNAESEGFYQVDVRLK